MLDTHKESSTPRLAEKNIHGMPQDTLNLRPLPRPLGKNGPYLGGYAKDGPHYGFQTPIERDCARIEDHSDLFRNLDKFEADLREAITRVWDRMTEIEVAERANDAGYEPSADIAGLASDALTLSFRFMQEAYLIAEVLSDREKHRIRQQEGRDFLALIPKTAPEHMTALERLAEQGRIEWQISVLLDRLAEQGIQRVWPARDAERLHRLNERMEAALKPATAERLNELSSDDLAAELIRLEEQVSQTRRQITVIHAIRTIRHG